MVSSLVFFQMNTLELFQCPWVLLPQTKSSSNPGVFHLLLSTDVWFIFFGIPEVSMPRLTMFKKQISNASGYLIMLNFRIKHISRCLVNIDDSDVTFYKERKRNSIVYLQCSLCGGELEVLCYVWPSSIINQFLGKQIGSCLRAITVAKQCISSQLLVQVIYYNMCGNNSASRQNKLIV